MTMRHLHVWQFWIAAAFLAILAAPQAQAQYAKAPDRVKPLKNVTLGGIVETFVM